MKSYKCHVQLCREMLAIGMSVNLRLWLCLTSDPVILAIVL